MDIFIDVPRDVMKQDKQNGCCNPHLQPLHSYKYYHYRNNHDVMRMVNCGVYGVFLNWPNQWVIFIYFHICIYMNNLIALFFTIVD